MFPAADYPNLLVGLTTPDDSAVYRLDDERAIVSTVDFFPPVVDNPYDFGAIAAANALSDVYAMGAEPLMAINLAAFPDDLEANILNEILRGGAEKVREAGAVIVGGHTVTDKEPKYGLAVTGIVHPSRVLTKGGARPGDHIILTKPLGTGVITTALKNQKAQQSHVVAAVTSMSLLNRTASRAACQVGVNAMTDITGYGLIGHGREVAAASGVDMKIDFRAIRWLPGADEYARQGSFPGGMRRNRDYFERWVRFIGDLDEYQQNLLFDPQTSGGLLIAVDPARAASLSAILSDGGVHYSIIGEIVSGSGNILVQS